MKKILKIVVGFIGVLLVLLITLPFVFKGKIIETAKDKINKKINAKVDFGDLSLSFIKNFPNASIEVTDLSVINFKPFEGDTLFYSKSIIFKTSIIDAINGNFNVKYFSLNDSKVNLFVNSEGVENFDIAKASSNTEVKTEGDSKNEPFILSVHSYEINNIDVTYNDNKAKMLFQLNNLSHIGSGDLSSERTKLVTDTSTDLKFVKDNTSLIGNLHLDLKATLDLDLKNQKFSFLDNEAHINKLPLIFGGFVKLNATNKEVKLDFKTPSSNFKNFLALVPKSYSKDTQKVTTTGEFTVVGKINGVVDDKHIPKIDVRITSNNASFKFPDLPKGVNNINIDTSIKNNTGLLKDMELDINQFSFKIDDNTFNASSRITRLTSNPYVIASLKGKLNLADIKKVYPLGNDMKLSGLIKADLKTKFDLDAVQKSIPERIHNLGKISMSDFEFTSKDMNHPLFINNAALDFQSHVISLTNFEAQTGGSDIKASGTLKDVLGFVLSDKKLKGNFSLHSEVFNVTDFMHSTDVSDTTIARKKTDLPTVKAVESDELKIPLFLDITTNVTAGKVLYDNLILSNIKGAMIVKDQKAILHNLSANMFDGSIVFNGTINTKKKIPVFNMKMAIKNFNIASSFASMEMLNKIAPISDIITGKFNTDISLNGNLTKDLTPDLMTLGGNALAELLDHKINPEKSKVMSLIGDNFKFINLKSFNLKNLKANLSFSDGKVDLKPLEFKYKDVKINASGSHGFDQKINYKLKFDIPAKFLGTKVTGLLSQLDKSNRNTIVPVAVNLTGDFSKPKVQTDMKSSLTKLTTQLVEQQKLKLKKKAVNEISKQIKNKELKNVVNGVLGGSKEKKQIKKEVTKKVKEKVKEKAKKELGKALGGFFK